MAKDAGSAPLPRDDNPQEQSWSRHASDYDQVFLNPLDPEVENPLWDALDRIAQPAQRSVIDLGCGTGLLLPELIRRFGRVVAVDFSPAMLDRAKRHLAEQGLSESQVEWQNVAMSDLLSFTGYQRQFDLAISINSLVMPDVRDVDASLVAIQHLLKSHGQFLGIVPAIDAIHYQTMLIHDIVYQLQPGLQPILAQRWTAIEAEHQFYDFGFGQFCYQGLRQRFWQPFEIPYRLTRAGFTDPRMAKVLYPWNDSMPGGVWFRDQPKSWDWFFEAGLDPQADSRQPGTTTTERITPPWIQVPNSGRRVDN